MNEHIRRFEDRAERLALEIDALAERPDIARIALAGVFGAAVLCWFAIAWGEGWLLLTLPILVGGCIWSARARANRPDPDIDRSDHEDPAELKEIDARLERLIASPARVEDPSIVEASAAAPAEPRVDHSNLFRTPVVEPASAEATARAISFDRPGPELQRLNAQLATLDPQPEPEPEIQAEADPDPVLTLYEVREIRAGAPILLEVRANFDAAVDIAFELIQERDPPELDIVAVRGDERETAWTYSRDAAGLAKPAMVELFGFDVTRWSGGR